MGDGTTAWPAKGGDRHLTGEGTVVGVSAGKWQTRRYNTAYPDGLTEVGRTLKDAGCPRRSRDGDGRCRRHTLRRLWVPVHGWQGCSYGMPPRP